MSNNLTFEKLLEVIKQLPKTIDPTTINLRITPLAPDNAFYRLGKSEFVEQITYVMSEVVYKHLIKELHTDNAIKIALEQTHLKSSNAKSLNLSKNSLKCYEHGLNLFSKCNHERK